MEKGNCAEINNNKYVLPKIILYNLGDTEVAKKITAFNRFTLQLEVYI